MATTRPSLYGIPTAATEITPATTTPTATTTMDPQPGTAAAAAAGGATGAAGQPPQEGICVAIRARPMNARERLSGQKSLWRCLPAHASITLTGPDGNPLPDRNPGFTFFTYDKVFPEGSSTEQVYQAIGAPIVASVLEGFNGTVSVGAWGREWKWGYVGARVLTH